MACQPGCECRDCMEPRDTPDSTRVDGFVRSNERCEFGMYDSEPFPISGNVGFWYTRAVYWKRECERNTGVQGPFCVPERLIEPHAEPEKPQTKYPPKYPMFKMVPTSSVNDDGSPMTNPCKSIPLTGLMGLDVLDLMQIQGIFALAGDNPNPIGRSE